MVERRNLGKWRKVRAAWRDTWILLGEFRLPLVLFSFLILGFGSLYHVLAKNTPNPAGSLAESFYIVLLLTFLQPINPFPDLWELQILYFLMPIAGIGILATGLADFGVLFFNRKARGKDWQMAVASTFSHHIVLVGLGHLGYRVVCQLNDIGQDVVIIDITPKPYLTDHLQQLGIPLIEDNAARADVLSAAGVQRARAIILCTQNDSLNLEIALKARNLNPKIEVIIRIFDDEFADSLQKQFGFRALSATGMAAPIFAAAATSVDITPPITVEGQPHILARLEVGPGSGLKGLTVSHIEESFHTSLVFLRQNGSTMFHPEGSIQVEAEASLAAFGTPENINHLLNENR
jgi:voltage-gated potassium channel